MGIFLDDDARWCRTCPVAQEVEPEAIEATCADCIDSDNCKDVALQDEYFRRLWRAVQLKRAGIPVMELIESLDDALAIRVVESEAERIEYDKRQDSAGDRAEASIEVEQR